MTILITLFILILGLTPSLLSIWVLRQEDSRIQARLRLIMDSIGGSQFPDLMLYPDRQYIDGLGYVVGDISCRFNARSSYLRCAVNPHGPCEGCSHYQSRV
ncbi:MAG: DUF6464 family protein [Elainellaceae cyanobacterium]